MHKFTDLFFRFLELLVVACMVAMVIMVFGNVVLRYGFNSGIDVSEELSRYCFIWLTFIGAIVAMREHGHVSVDFVIRKLPRLGKQACLILSEILMLVCNGLFFLGTWKMHELQVTNISVVLGISMIWIYAVGYVTSAAIGVINLHRISQLLCGRLPEGEHTRHSSEPMLQPASAHVTGARN